MERHVELREQTTVEYFKEQVESALARQHVRYVGSKTTHIYCFPTCRHAKRIKDENRVPIHDEAEAAAKGFRPCLVCRPLSKAS